MGDDKVKGVSGREGVYGEEDAVRGIVDYAPSLENRYFTPGTNVATANC